MFDSYIQSASQWFIKQKLGSSKRWIQSYAAISPFNSKQRLLFIEKATQLYDSTEQIQLSSYLVEERVPAEITTLLDSYCVPTAQ